MKYVRHIYYMIHVIDTLYVIFLSTSICFICNTLGYSKSQFAIAHLEHQQEISNLFHFIAIVYRILNM